MNHEVQNDEVTQVACWNYQLSAIFWSEIVPGLLNNMPSVTHVC